MTEREVVTVNGKQFHKYPGNTFVSVESTIGKDVTLWFNIVIWGNCKIGDNVKVGSHVTLGNVTIGDNCKIEDFAFVPPGVTIDKDVFIGPHTCFTNDTFPQVNGEWRINETIVRDKVSIGANSTVMSGLILNKEARVGAGSTITKGVSTGALAYGESAKERRTIH